MRNYKKDNLQSLGLNESSPDDVLFARFQQDEQVAFEIIYGRYNKMLYTLALRFVKDRYAAESVVQHVFTKLWEHRFDISVDICLRNYLYTMTKNNVLNYIRNNNSALVKNYEIAQRAEMYDDALSSLLERKEVYDLLQQSIEQLPEQKRAVVVMKRDGKSNQEIADELHISVNTVKVHYQQSLKMLKDKLTPIIKSLPSIVVLWLLSGIR